MFVFDTQGNFHKFHQLLKFNGIYIILKVLMTNQQFENIIDVQNIFTKTKTNQNKKNAASV